MRRTQLRLPAGGVAAPGHGIPFFPSRSGLTALLGLFFSFPVGPSRPASVSCRLDMKPRGGGRRQDASRVVRKEKASCRTPAADVFSPAPFPSAREQADATGGTRPSCCSAAFANRSIRATGGCHPYACPRGAQIGISAGTGQPGKVGYNGGANGSRTLCHAVASSDRLIAGGKNCGPPGRQACEAATRTPTSRLRQWSPPVGALV